MRNNKTLTYISTTDRAAALRAELKKLGISSRQVSIRTDYYSGGSAIHVMIKDPSISLAKVESLATVHESIHRDMFGEILSGCNRYVSVDYSTAASDAIRNAYLPAVKTAIDTLGTSESSLIPVADTPFSVGRNNGSVTVWRTDDDPRTSGFVANTYDANGAARLIGVKMRDAQTAA